ncbi:MAG: LacI family DNA-binding transcriptional regulator [Phycisphaeraceae bacterium]|nr:LacI family DNA-binding transcriptional regulator [Phycisphaeraceae bacterium]
MSISSRTDAPQPADADEAIPSPELPSQDVATATLRKRDITLQDVADRARVSIGTVSRVMNHAPNVAADLRKHVLLTGRSLGFIPRRPQRCIAVITGRRSPALPVGYVSVMTSLLCRVLSDRGYAVELIDVEHLELAYQAHIEGVIGVVFDDRLTELRAIPNLELLTISKPMTELGIHSIRSDHHFQAKVATEHLLARGHRRIGFMSIEPGEWGSDERKRGFLEAMRNAGVEVDPLAIRYTQTEAAYDILTRWIGRGFTALLNFSEDASLEVLHILSNVLKLKIGQDVSTISLEDLPVYRHLTPPQTTVRQPLEEMARVAVDLLLERIELRRQGRAPREPVDVVLPSDLIERDSVGTLT